MDNYSPCGYTLGDTPYFQAIDTDLRSTRPEREKTRGAQPVPVITGSGAPFANFPGEGLSDAPAWHFRTIRRVRGIKLDAVAPGAEMRRTRCFYNFPYESGQAFGI